MWHIENPPSATGFSGFGTIEPAVGRVAPRGSTRVTPTATTTYTLAAGALTKTVTVTVPGTKPSPRLRPPLRAPSTGIQRTPDGKPDFSGVYGWAKLFGAAEAAQRPRSSPEPRSIACSAARSTPEPTSELSAVDSAQLVWRAV